MIRPGLRLVPWLLLSDLKNLAIRVSLPQLVLGGLLRRVHDQQACEGSAASVYHLFRATSVSKPGTRHALSGGKLPVLFVAELMR